MRTAALCLAAAACAADPVVIAVTPLGATHDTAGPYGVDAVVVGAAGARVDLRWGTGDGDPAGMARAPMQARGDDLWFGAIPGQPAGTAVFYAVEVVRDGDVVARAPDDGLARAFGFRVLRPDGACDVDSECALGAEVCAGGRCTPLPGVCAADADCPGGYACDAATGTCALPPRSCATDADCPASDRCDAGACVPRHLCGDAVPCPAGFTCNPALGRCFSE
ncbi:MAG: hypothetical protein D6689_12440 [Deltaproteobacteria bacterium]|nr:MAG: hypothetical protein D6689_12440 [Deltaproteobacteria bacterium]